MRELLRKLLAEYGTAAERKNNSIAGGTRLLVDGRGAGDLGPEGRPHANFCAIAIDVAGAPGAPGVPVVRVELDGNIPWSAALEAWTARNAALATRPGMRSFTLKLGPATLGALTEVAQMFREIGKPAGSSYVPSPLKYASLRTARSLDQLHAVLGRVWKPA